MTTQTKSSIALDIIHKLWRLNRIFCSPEYDESIHYLKSIIPFKTHEYRTKKPYKGWEIPPNWSLKKGTISFDGKILFEVDHPLKIIGLSKSFQGTVSKEELQKHLHFDHRDPTRIPYHFRQHYRPWERDWGFCVTKEFYDSLENGNYEIDIVVKESPGNLKVTEYVKQGKHPEGFAFVAHLDHPGMANDDLAGVAAGVELFHRLSQIETKFTYRLVLVQEIIGSVFYLDHSLSDTVLESCFIEMVGSKTPLALQHSRLGKSNLEKTLIAALKEKGIDHRTGPFRSIISNDEVVWESRGIPMCSLSRFPYPEYHSDSDNPSIIDQSMLTESVDVLYTAILDLEKQTLIKKNFEGVFSLAHPHYQLYIDPGQPAFGYAAQASNVQLRALMDELSLMPKFSFVSDIARELQMPEDLVLSYFEKCAEKGLLEIL